MPSTVNPHGSPMGKELSPPSTDEERQAQEGQSCVRGAGVSGSTAQGAII